MTSLCSSPLIITIYRSLKNITVAAFRWHGSLISLLLLLNKEKWAINLKVEKHIPLNHFPKFLVSSKNFTHSNTKNIHDCLESKSILKST
jgi:hypothetical protein